MRNLLNSRKKVRKFKKEKEVMKIGRKDSGELLMKYRGIIDVQSILAKDHMVHKGH